MKTFKRICIKDYSVTDYFGNTFKIERGKEYLTSAVNESPSIGPHPKENHVVVFSNFWVHVPLDYFAGEIQFTFSD